MEKVNINREKNTENCIALIDYENCSNLTEIPLNIYTELIIFSGAKQNNVALCVFRSIRSRIGIEVRSAIRIHSINRELNFFYRFLTRFFAAFHYRGIFPQ